MPRYYFEDFTVGRVFEAAGPVISQEEIIEFASKYDPQTFHVDPDAARHSSFGGLVASGWQTLAFAMRMTCDAYLLEAATFGSPGVDEVRWTKPVRPGDTLRLRMTVLEARPSGSKPDRGTVVFRREVFNQNGELVMHMRNMTLFQRRPAA